MVSDGREMIDSTIIKFFRKHHVLTIATTVENEPWCANCFYVYLEEENSLVFTTDTGTRHGEEFIKNPLVAGSVVLETGECPTCAARWAPAKDGDSARAAGRCAGPGRDSPSSRRWGRVE